MTTMTTQDAVAAIVEQIARSSLLSEEQKQEYIEHLEKNGFSEDFIDKLDRLFAEEAEGVEKEIQESQELITALDNMIAEEDTKNDEAQAGILRDLHEASKEQVKNFQHEIAAAEQEIENTVEGATKTGEAKDIASIRAKLQKK